ncbi:MAG: AMP-binding protein [Gemmobacter sp.]
MLRAAGVRWTYAELAQAVDRLAAGLLSLGVYRGDRVGIWAPNRPEWLLLQFATARIGAILVTINPACRAPELGHALRKVGVKALVLAPAFRGSDYMAILSEVAPDLAASMPGRLAAARLPDLRAVVQLGPDPAPGTLAFDAVMAAGGAAGQARLDAIGAALAADDAINIQFTSGTTGAPKGATLTHRNILNNAISAARCMKLTPADRLCIPVPLYHCFGMVLGVLAATAYGATMVFPGEGFDPGETLAALAAERCTAVHGVPTMFQAMLDDPGFAAHDLTALRTGVMAGAPCPAPLMRRLIGAMLCRQITIAYGMTETAPVSFQTAVDDPEDRRVNTVGRVQPHVECRVIDAAGRTVPVGTQGEVITRGYLVMKGYWGDADRTAEAIRDGWMHSGDRAVMDAEGYLRIIGRSGDMLIRGGENVYPAEVEAMLMTHPAIAQAQVFGLPDARPGEDVAAWIILRPGAALDADALRAWCKDRIAGYKTPRHIRFVAAFPMTATGKPQKFRMRAAMLADPR